VLERPGLVLSENDDLASPFSKAFEQFPRLSFPMDATAKSGGRR
jgi:hypothetical protein